MCGGLSKKGGPPYERLEETQHQTNGALLLRVISELGEGGNTKLACVALSLAHIAAISAVDLFDFADADSTYWNAKAGNMNAQLALNASNQIGNIAAGTSGDVTAIKAELDALSLYVSSTLTPDLNKIMANQATILANQATILQLLSTPQGQRAGFPAN